MPSPFLPEPWESVNPYPHVQRGQCLACRWNWEYVKSGTMDDCPRCDHVHPASEPCPFSEPAPPVRGWNHHA